MARSRRSAGNTDRGDALLLRGATSCFEGGREALAGKEERQGERELQERIARARAGAGSQDLRARDRGGSIAGLGVSARAARSRELVAKGRRPAAVARVLQVNRPGLYRTPKRRPKAARRPLIDPVDRRSSRLPDANPTDGTRMVAALVSRRLGAPGQPQARTAGDARAAAAATPPAVAPAAASRLLPRRAARTALASRHDLDLGRRARLDAT